jgi:hypothetical protein
MRITTIVCVPQAGVRGRSSSRARAKTDFVASCTIPLLPSRTLPAETDDTKEPDMGHAALPFTADDVERTLLPLERATQLPPAAFTDEAVLEWELEHLFRTNWVCACHADQVGSRGQFVMVELGGDSVIVVADDDGLPRAFRNRCRHRGARLVDTAEGTMPRLQCPYHAWT